MSTQIQFYRGFGWDVHPPVMAVQFISQAILAERLNALRQEWQVAVGEGKYLDLVNASVGLMLNDFASIIELRDCEK